MKQTNKKTVWWSTFAIDFRNKKKHVQFCHNWKRKTKMNSFHALNADFFISLLLFLRKPFSRHIAFGGSKWEDSVRNNISENKVCVTNYLNVIIKVLIFHKTQFGGIWNLSKCWYWRQAIWSIPPDYAIKINSHRQWHRSHEINSNLWILMIVNRT